MNYRLHRYERKRDRAGNVIGIFVAVRIRDEESGESLTQEYHLTKTEVAEVLENEDNLTSILKTVAVRGTIQLEEDIETKPQPRIVADSTKLASFFPDPSDLEIEEEIRRRRQLDEEQDTTATMDM